MLDGLSKPHGFLGNVVHSGLLQDISHEKTALYWLRRHACTELQAWHTERDYFNDIELKSVSAYATKNPQRHARRWGFLWTDHSSGSNQLVAGFTS